MEKAFTMVELIFVIVVIGILSAVAIPRLAATRDDAVISKAMATVGALRSAISTERQKNILKGVFADIDGATAEGLLQYGLGSGWSRSGNEFTFTGPGSTSCVFDLNSSLLVRGSCSVPNMTTL